MSNFWSLSYQLAKAEFKLRNEGSYLGILWYLLNPLLTFLLLLLIFEDRLGKGIPKYPLYLLLGIIMFNFFQQATQESVRVIWRNSVIKSLNFPKETLVMSNVLKIIFSHAFELLLFIFVLIIYGNFNSGILIYLIILFFLFIFVYGFSLMLASLSVYFVDLNNIWTFVSRLVWLGTPIFYAVEGQTRLGILNLFNPMYYFITVSRDIIIYSRIPEMWVVLGMMIYSFLFLIAGMFIFNKLKYKFAELI